MSVPLRVAIVSRAIAPLHGIGGLERSVHDLVVHLARRGLEVTVITPPPRDPAARYTLPATFLHVPYRSFPLANRRGTTILDRDTAYPLFGWRAGRTAHALVTRGAIDVVHGFGASVFGYALARGRDPLATAPLILNPQGLEEFGGSAPDSVKLKRLAYAPLQFVVRVCARYADRVIATDRSLAPVVRRHLDVGSDRLATIPNAIDLGACDALVAGTDRTAVRLRYGIEDGRYLFVSAGRLEQNKGFHVLARALGALGTTAEWHWILAGDGPFRPQIERAIVEAGIGARTRLAGRVDDATLHGLYGAADVFVHPTLYEGSSLVTLEAMARGVPVIATWAGGLPDKVRAHENGWLVAAGDPDALARALREAIEAGADLRQRFGQASRRIVEREFSWDVVAAQTHDLYAQLREASPPQQRQPRIG